MMIKLGWTRRMVLAAKAALAGSLSLPVSAFAGTKVSTGVADAPGPVAPARWPTATATEMQPYVGQRFRVHTREHGTLVLKLVDVYSPAKDPARPTDLPRRTSLSALFDGPDAQLLAEAEDAMHWVSHPKIGKVYAYLKPMPRRGGYEIEMILS